MPRRPAAPALNPIFHEPTFSEDATTLDPTGFATQHPSDIAEYARLKQLLTKSVVGFDKARGAPGDLYRLSDAYGPSHGPQVEQTITSNGKIVFHMLGDSGASNAGLYNDEIKVADRVTQDCQTSDETNRPAFLFHMGDIIYSFGESEYYYDQFYEPFRNYPAPIFAIPGNHDSFVIPGTPATFARAHRSSRPKPARCTGPQ